MLTKRKAVSKMRGTQVIWIPTLTLIKSLDRVSHGETPRFSLLDHGGKSHTCCRQHQLDHMVRNHVQKAVVSPDSEPFLYKHTQAQIKHD